MFSIYSFAHFEHRAVIPLGGYVGAVFDPDAVTSAVDATDVLDDVLVGYDSNAIGRISCAP
jgi:hypothetical protein